jgi:TolA-binding protein
MRCEFAGQWLRRALAFGAVSVLGFSLAGCGNENPAPDNRAAEQELQQLQQDNQELQRLRADNQELPRLQRDSAELERLRSETKDLPQLRKENQELQAQLAAAQAPRPRP